MTTIRKYSLRAFCICVLAGLSTLGFAITPQGTSSNNPQLNLSASGNAVSSSLQAGAGTSGVVVRYYITFGDWYWHTDLRGAFSRAAQCPQGTTQVDGLDSGVNGNFAAAIASSGNNITNIGNAAVCCNSGQGCPRGMYGPDSNGCGGINSWVACEQYFPNVSATAVQSILAAGTAGTITTSPETAGTGACPLSAGAVQQSCTLISGTGNTTATQWINGACQTSGTTYNCYPASSNAIVYTSNTGKEITGNNNPLPSSIATLIGFTAPANEDSTPFDIFIPPCPAGSTCWNGCKGNTAGIAAPLTLFNYNVSTTTCTSLLPLYHSPKGYTCINGTGNC